MTPDGGNARYFAGLTRRRGGAGAAGGGDAEARLRGGAGTRTSLRWRSFSWRSCTATAARDPQAIDLYNQLSAKPTYHGAVWAARNCQLAELYQSEGNAQAGEGHLRGAEGQGRCEAGGRHRGGEAESCAGGATDADTAIETAQAVFFSRMTAATSDSVCFSGWLLESQIGCLGLIADHGFFPSEDGGGLGSDGPDGLPLGPGARLGHPTGQRHGEIVGERLAWGLQSARRACRRAGASGSPHRRRLAWDITRRRGQTDCLR